MSRHKKDGKPQGADLFACHDEDTMSREETIEFLLDALKTHTFDDFVFIGFPSDKSPESINNLACLVTPGQKLFSATRLCALLSQLGALFLRRSGVHDALTYEPTDEKIEEAIDVFSQLIAEISVSFRGFAVTQAAFLLPSDELRAKLGDKTEQFALGYQLPENPPAIIALAAEEAEKRTDPINQRMRIRNINSSKDVDKMNNWKEFLK